MIRWVVSLLLLLVLPAPADNNAPPPRIDPFRPIERIQDLIVEQTDIWFWITIHSRRESDPWLDGPVVYSQPLPEWVFPPARDGVGRKFLFFYIPRHNRYTRWWTSLRIPQVNGGVEVKTLEPSHRYVWRVYAMQFLIVPSCTEVKRAW